jgi:uncharacterized RDD family membrane protein YckC
MARKQKGDGEPLLFDLPLQPDTDPGLDEPFDLGGEAGELAGNGAGGPTELDEPEEQTVEEGSGGADVIPIQTRLFQDGEEEDEEEEDDDLSGETASFGDRVLSGVSDLAVHLAVLGVAVLGCSFLGVRVELADWPPLTLFTLIFSFLYWTIPLAFWGQTPGMAWIGTAAHSADDQPLAFGQTLLRWLGALATLALLGIPLLGFFGEGRSLSDWISDSKTELI